ncbi:unnamed protein product, partial [Didymodactylos carnosus]
AIDVIVVKQEDGTFLCTPFHVRFGKLGVIQSSQKRVYISINNETVDLWMQLGEAGEAVFIDQTNMTDDRTKSSIDGAERHLEPSDDNTFLDPDNAFSNAVAAADGEHHTPLTNIDRSPQFLNKKSDIEKTVNDPNTLTVPTYAYEQPQQKLNVDVINSTVKDNSNTQNQNQLTNSISFSTDPFSNTITEISTGKTDLSKNNTTTRSPLSQQLLALPKQRRRRRVKRCNTIASTVMTTTKSTDSSSDDDYDDVNNGNKTENDIQVKNETAECKIDLQTTPTDLLHLFQRAEKILLANQKRFVLTLRKQKSAMRKKKLSGNKQRQNSTNTDFGSSSGYYSDEFITDLYKPRSASIHHLQHLIRKSSSENNLNFLYNHDLFAFLPKNKQQQPHVEPSTPIPDIAAQEQQTSTMAVTQSEVEDDLTPTNIGKRKSFQEEDNISLQYVDAISVMSRFSGSDSRRVSFPSTLDGGIMIDSNENEQQQTESEQTDEYDIDLDMDEVKPTQTTSNPIAINMSLSQNSNEEQSSPSKHLTSRINSNSHMLITDNLLSKSVPVDSSKYMPLSNSLRSDQSRQSYYFNGDFLATFSNWYGSSKKSPSDICLDDTTNNQCDPSLYSPKLENTHRPEDDRDSGKGYSIPQSPFHEHETSCILGDAQLSLCGNLNNPLAITDDLFNKHLVPYQQFITNTDITNNPNLVVRINGKYYSWAVASVVMASASIYHEKLPQDIVDSLQEKHMIPKQTKTRHSSERSGWWLPWSKKIKTPTDSTTKTVTDNNTKLKDTESSFQSQKSFVNIKKRDTSKTDDSELEDNEVRNIISNIENKVTKIEQAQEQQQSLPIFVQQKPVGRKTMILSSDQLKKLNLKLGKNPVQYSVTTALQGTTTVESNIFLFDYLTKFVISDIDGTITRSDALGHILPLIGRDWSQDGITEFFDAIQENGYQFIYLSARAIGQSSITREFLKSIKQCDCTLPAGPLLISPDSLMTALYREVIAKKPEEFKIECLKNIASLFPNKNPFYAGFGNRINYAYTAVGIPLTRIFTINPRGEVVRQKLQALQSSYRNLHEVVDLIFPPMDHAASETYSTFTFWRCDPFQFDTSSQQKLESEMQESLDELEQQQFALKVKEKTTGKNKNKTQPSMTTTTNNGDKITIAQNATGLSPSSN